MTAKALHIVDLAKRYPTGVEALKGVSIDIEPASSTGCSAPNGAGKSTLIHCTTGLAQPTGGSIEVFGHDAIAGYGDARQAVGLAPQEINLDWFLTAEETLDFHGGYFGMAKRERRERTEELLETFSLTAKAAERTRTLSGGMKRRLILARALMHRPRLLILDEPTAGVDIELRLELWHYVQKINQEGTTILLTTHYLEEAEQALQQDRLHRRRPDRRSGDERGAGRPLRRAQPRGRLPDPGRSQRAVPIPRRGPGPVSTAQIRFATLWRREISRFMKIKKQTLGGPLLETFLYITVFGAALGSRIKQLHGIDYILFVIPGLIMMSWATNAFTNNSSSILQQKFRARSTTSSPLRPRRWSCCSPSPSAASCAGCWSQ